jgi:hypothetical protein
VSQRKERRGRQAENKERIKGGSMLRESNGRNNKKGLDHKCGAFGFFHVLNEMGLRDQQLKVFVCRQSVNPIVFTFKQRNLDVVEYFPKTMGSG